MSLNLASLREACGARLAAWALIPATTEPLCPLLSVLDVGFCSVPEQILGIRKRLAADAPTTFVPPETPVLFISFELDRALC
jgi:hypothetical protein